MSAPAVRGRERPPAPARAWWRPTAWPWWAQTLAVWVATRAFSAVLLLVVARTQEATVWTPASPSYAQYTGAMWDASWYRLIAEEGYPDGLPVGPDGRVPQTAWAFFPLFPALVRAVVAVTGASWDVAAPTLALVLGTAAALVVHRVVAAAVARSSLAPRVGRALPLASVALLGASAAAPVLQVAYTESLALLLLAAVLWCLVERWYLAAVPLVLGLGLTRAVALPVAVAVVAHGVARRRDERAGGPPVPAGDWARLGALLAASGLAGVAWPALVGLLTGVPDAYARTQGAWRGRGAVVPLLPWVDVARFFTGPLWPVVLLAVLAAGTLVASVGPIRRLGPELWGWTAGYLAYLLVAIEPGTSLVRFVLLAFPLASVAAVWALERPRPRAALTSLLVAAALTQVAWVALVWRLVPPAGWPP